MKVYILEGEYFHSEWMSVFKEIATYLGDRLMPIKYMRENDFKNMTAVPIKEMKGKVVIMIEKNGDRKSTRLNSSH